MDDAGANEVLRIGIDALEQREAVADQLRLGLRLVHWQRRLEYLLRLLRWSVKVKTLLYSHAPTIHLLNLSGVTKRSVLT